MSEAQTESKSTEGYTAVVGISHKEIRIEAGKPVKGLPDAAIKSLLKQGAIQKASK